MNKLTTAMTALLLSCQAHAGPFDSCPADAYLIQGSSYPSMYSVDLATGGYALLGEIDSASMNAIGYSLHDDYIYGWSKQHQQVVRIHSDFSFDVLTMQDKPANNIYVGDVSPLENIYYFYHPNVGIYRMSLDQFDPDYLRAIQISSRAAFRKSIYDLAINPNDGFAYSVDRNGRLLKIDLATASTSTTPHTDLGNVGQSGTFGAVYFDSNDYLYISNNASGKIFRIDVNQDNPVAELFASGPSSSSNDGARCSSAAIVDVAEPTLDFGDAPDSYGTSCDETCSSNGARHAVDPEGLFLGTNVNADAAAYEAPLSDDNDGASDEDGIDFVSGIDATRPNVAVVTSSGDGYLNAWVDWDQGGTFDNDDQIIEDASVTSGDNFIVYEAPVDAAPGETWSRFRLSTVPGLEPTGGAPDGEVEDYKINVIKDGITTHYPSVDGWVTLAYEDNWPVTGDYDMNDVVMNYRVAITRRDDLVSQVRVQGKLVALGGSYRHGFAVHLDGVDKASVDESGIIFNINNILQNTNPIEADNSDLVIMLTQDLSDYTRSAESCTYFRTQLDCQTTTAGVFEFDVTVPFEEASLPSVTNFPAAPFDPFIFATPGSYHGDHILQTFGENPGRGLEIHLKNKRPTALFDSRYANTGDDASQGDMTFQTNQGMPWAMEVSTEWRHPRERVDLMQAYPEFRDFVMSSGAQNKQWYRNDRANTNFTYND